MCNSNFLNFLAIEAYRFNDSGWCEVKWFAAHTCMSYGFRPKLCCISIVLSFDQLNIELNQILLPLLFLISG